ncbi:hypothetical protein YB2330_003556 [Saitoella coloradoensis]
MSAGPLLSQYLGLIKTANDTKNSQSINSLFIFDPNTPGYADLRRELIQTNANVVEVLCDNLDQGGSRAFGNLIHGYLTFMKNCDFSSELSVFEHYSKLMNQLHAAYGSDAGFLNTLVMRMARWYTELSMAADQMTGNRALGNTEKAATLLQRMHPHICQVPSKRIAAYYVANLLFRLYFRLRKTTLMGTTMESINSQITKIEGYPLSQIVEYRYYQGRYELSRNQFPSAREHLLWAFNNCMDASHRNRRLILIYLTAAGLVIGMLPREDLLRRYNLTEYFLPLIHAQRKGDFALHALTIEMHKAWYLKWGIYLILRDRLQLLLFRSLFRRTHILTKHKTPKENQVWFDDLLAATRLSTQRAADAVRSISCTPDDEPEWDILDVEAMAANFVDQGYIKGTIHSSRKIMVVAKDLHDAFPKVSTITVARLKQQ